jgi:hypothetical protein
LLFLLWLLHARPHACSRRPTRFLAEKKFDAAIAAWGPLTTKFPGSEPAGHAHFVTASLFEN